MTHGAYLASLLFSLCGLVIIDRRYRLAFFKYPKRAALVLAVGLGIFIIWDLLGIALDIFIDGNSRYALPFQLAPEFPLEEMFFLSFLCYLSLVCYLLLGRLRKS